MFHSVQSIESAQKLLKQAELSQGTIEDRKAMFIDAARTFYSIAEQVTDTKCKATLIFMAASAIQRVEDITRLSRQQAAALKQPMKAMGSTTSSNATSTKDNLQIDSNRHVFGGRITLPSARTDIKGIREIRKAAKVTSEDALSDLFLLEKTLDDIGLMRALSLKETPIAHGSHVSPLGESFMLLPLSQSPQQRMDTVVKKAPLQQAAFQPSFLSTLPEHTVIELDDASHVHPYRGPSAKSSTSVSDASGTVSNSAGVDKKEGSRISPYGNSAKPSQDQREGNSGWGGLANAINWSSVLAAAATATATVAGGIGLTGSTDSIQTPSKSVEQVAYRGYSGLPPLHPQASIQQQGIPDWSTQSTSASLFGIGSMDSSLRVDSSASLMMNSVSAADIRDLFGSSSVANSPGRLQSQAGNRSKKQTSITQQPGRAAIDPDFPAKDDENFPFALVNPDVGPEFSAEGVSRLLASIQRLGEENQELLERVNNLRVVERQNVILQNEMKVFKQEYKKNFARLKEYLSDFAAKHPHPDNPANIFSDMTASGSPISLSQSLSLVGMRRVTSPDNSQASNNSDSLTRAGDNSIPRDSNQILMGGVGVEAMNPTETASQIRVEQLERITKKLLQKLEDMHATVDKKNKLISKYEQFIRQHSADRTLPTVASPTRLGSKQSIPASHSNNLLLVPPTRPSTVSTGGAGLRPGGMSSGAAVKSPSPLLNSNRQLPSPLSFPGFDGGTGDGIASRVATQSPVGSDSRKAVSESPVRGQESLPPSSSPIAAISMPSTSAAAATSPGLANPKSTFSTVSSTPASQRSKNPATATMETYLHRGSNYR